MSKIIERIEREAGVPGLTSILAERLTPTDLQSLLLEVYRRRSARRKPADVLSSYESDRFVRHSSVAPGRLLAWEQVAFAMLPAEFTPLALSPVCPLGASSVVAHLDQNWAVATSRNTEVVSDATNVLALECAVQRRELLRADPKSIQPVHLAASQRLLRAQRFTNPNLVTHFSCFALCSAGRNHAKLEFEIAAIHLHIRFYLEALQAFLGQEAALAVSITDFSLTARESQLDTDLLQPFRIELASVELGIDEERTKGRGYYRGLCFHIHAKNASGQWIELVDGGSVDWTQQYLSNARERLVISGIGSDRLLTFLE